MEISHQNTIQTELELKFAAKEKALESEKNLFQNKANEYERVLKKNRKNESTMKDEIVKLKNQLSMQRHTFDQRLFELQNDNEALKQELNYATHELNNRISEITRENAELSGQLTATEEELESYKTTCMDLKQRLEEFKSLKSDLEQERVNHQNSLLKIKELDYEIHSYGDWKDVAKASHSRMSTMSDMEKEVVRLRQANKNLRDSLGNKLLLEEEVHTLRTRLERFEKSSVDQINLQTQIDALERELKEWKQLGVDFVQKGAANNPISVRSYIQQLMHRDLLLVSEKTSVSSEKSTTQSQITDLTDVSHTSFQRQSSSPYRFKCFSLVFSKMKDCRSRLKPWKSH
jgi:DNA repair exonuclease SbcCD ATPase subunit